MNSPVGVTTAYVAEDGLEAYMSEDVGLQAVRATTTIVAFGPGTRKGEGGSLLSGRKRSILRNIVGEPLDLGELLDPAGASGQLVCL